MRIVYGVHGYGRGHAMRALAVLPALTRRHEVLILTGGDAYDALAPHYPVIRIPILRYETTPAGKVSAWSTLKRNVPIVLNLLFGGSEMRKVQEAIRDFAGEIIVTDSEGFTHRAARRMGLPCVSFDHFGVLVYCRPIMSMMDRLKCAGNAFVYGMLFGRPDRMVVSSFFDAPARTGGVRVVGPVMREEVQSIQPSRGEHLLVYMSTGAERFVPGLERAMSRLDVPFRVYGIPREGKVGNVEYKPIANLPFIRDLASCRAVVATTGNQLLGEAVYYQKPILGVPLDCLEQRLNAAQVKKMGIGSCADGEGITAEAIGSLIDREDEFLRGFTKRPASAADDAVEAIEQFGEQLMRQAG